MTHTVLAVRCQSLPWPTDFTSPSTQNYSMPSLQATSTSTSTQKHSLHSCNFEDARRLAVQFTDPRIGRGLFAKRRDAHTETTAATPEEIGVLIVHPSSDFLRPHLGTA